MARRILEAVDGSGSSRRAAEFDEVQQQAERVVARSSIDEAIAEVGDPVDVIHEMAEAEDVDLIVVGASDTGWWSRLVDGSVSDELVRHGERPVLVFR
jgi:nucleotide-binding universal stress UspA family protein